MKRQIDENHFYTRSERFMSDSKTTKKTVVQPEELGNVHIAEDVIASIAALAAAEVEGVATLSSNMGQDLAELLGKKNLSRGVKIAVENNSVTADVYLLIKRNYTILKVSQAVQENVKSSIESMTGLTAPSVNVHVAGIVFEKEQKQK
jgi:uncharacterized alkaline shock family protein YloU